MIKTLKICKVDDFVYPDQGYLPDYGNIPRLKLQEFIGQRCVIVASMMSAEPPYRPLHHCIQLDDGREFFVDADQLVV